MLGCWPIARGIILVLVVVLAVSEDGLPGRVIAGGAVGEARKGGGCGEVEATGVLLL